MKEPRKRMLTHERDEFEKVNNIKNFKHPQN